MLQASLQPVKVSLAAVMRKKDGEKVSPYQGALEGPLACTLLVNNKSSSLMCSKRFQLSRQTYTYLKKKTGLSGRQTAQSKLLPAYQSVVSNAPDDEKKQIKQYR